MPGDVFRFGRYEVRAHHTPGHSPDHVAFWHDASRGLYTGDLVIADGSVVIEASRGGNLTEYLASLQRILELEPRQLFPAHGPRVDNPPALVRASTARAAPPRTSMPCARVPVYVVAPAAQALGT